MDKNIDYPLLYERERVKLLLNQNPFFFLGLLGNILAFVYITKAYIELNVLLTWAIAALSFSIVRVLFVKKTLKEFDQVTRVGQLCHFERLYAVGTFISGLFWSFACIYFLPEGQIGHHAVTGFLLAGMTAAVTAGYAVSPKTFYAFVIPIGIPYMVRLILEGTSFHLTMAAMVAIFMTIMFIVYRTIHNYSLDSLNYALESEQRLKKLSEKQSEVAYTSRMATLGELSANIAHEINNPLTVLNTGLQLMQTKLNEKTLDRNFLQDVCQRLENTTHRISETVKALRAFSRDNKEINYERVSITEIINDGLSLARSKFQTSGIDLKFAAPKEDIFIHCYPVQIRQIVINLINNAFDAVNELSIENKWIKISITEKEQVVQLSFKDCGKGIPKDVQKNMLLPFYSTKKGLAGTGLGLAMVSGIVKKHQGRMWVNNDSLNTEFVIELPKKVDMDDVENIAS